MKDYIEALREIKKENKDFKITLSRKEVLELVNEFDRLNSIIEELTQENLKRSDKIDELLEIKNKAIEYIECGKTFDDIETARIIDKYEKILLEILKGSDKE